MKFTSNSAVALFSTVCLISACAKHPDKIQAQYVSPMQYDGYSCKQIGAEMQRLSVRVSELGGQQEHAANTSDVEMGVGLVLLWPVLLFLDSNSAQAAEYARVKGEFEALDQKAIQKNCNLHIERPKVVVPESKSETPAYPSETIHR